MKRVFLDGLGRLPVVRDVEVPEITDEEVLIKVKVASICNLTDVHTIEGTHPPHHVWAEGYLRTPAHAWPAPLGHESAGEVVKVGKYAAREFAPGDRVCTIHASETMSEYVKARPEWLAKLPDSVSYEEASPIELLSWVNILVEDTVRPGTVVAILGQGSSGLMATQCAKVAGARRIIVSDPVREKRELALKLGADIALDPTSQDIVKEIERLTDGKGVDTVVECAGIPDTIRICTQLVRKREPHLGGTRPGTIAVFGACWDPVPFDFFELHFKGAHVVTAGATTLGYTKAGLQRGVDLVASGQIKMRPLLTHKFYIDDVAEAFKLLMEKREPAVKVLIVPDKEYFDHVRLGD
ncbi:MAG TPA: zinc-binding dehydrogenase [Firmicutes bacterium]|nr:zinc-binding dehydrogenase [Bacillota bacterium]